MNFGGLWCLEDPCGLFRFKVLPEGTGSDFWGETSLACVLRDFGPWIVWILLSEPMYHRNDTPSKWNGSVYDSAG